MKQLQSPTHHNQKMNELMINIVRTLFDTHDHNSTGNIPRAQLNLILICLAENLALPAPSESQLEQISFLIETKKSNKEILYQKSSLI